MMTEQLVCYLLIAWAMARARHMLPDSPLVDKLGISILGGAAVLWLAETYIYGATHVAGKVMLIGVALWVLPPSLRCWFAKVHVPVPIRLLLRMRK
jgi:hypothetical protein